MKRGVSKKKPAPVKKSPPVEDWGQVLRTFSGRRISQEDMCQIMFREFPDVMNLKEVCKILGVSSCPPRSACANGRCPAHCIRYPAA